MITCQSRSPLRSSVPGSGLAAAVLRLSGQGAGGCQPENLKLISNGVQLALDCNRVWVEEREVDLTETEYKILRMLMQNPERIFSVEMIYETVWVTLLLYFQRHGHGPPSATCGQKLKPTLRTPSGCVPCGARGTGL